MPRDKDLKRLVRARMEKTGEAYTTARAHLLRTPRTRSLPDDLASRAGMADAVIETKTGKTWRQWVRLLDARDASTMKHGDIVAIVHGEHGVPAWWSQSVVVGYERITGLRARGQRRDGSYEANKSRTFDVPVGVLFDAWADAAVRRRWLDETGVRVRTATRPRSMRLGWPDGRIIPVGFMAKGARKSAVALTHPKLPDPAAVQRMKTYWSERLDALAALLARTT